jgi:hypothetical protein
MREINLAGDADNVPYMHKKTVLVIKRQKQSKTARIAAAELTSTLTNQHEL